MAHGKSVGMQDSNHHEPATAGDIRAMADPDAVMSPANKNGGLVSKPCGLRAPHSFRYGPHYSAPGGAQKLQGVAYSNAYGGCSLLSLSGTVKRALERWSQPKHKAATLGMVHGPNFPRSEASVYCIRQTYRRIEISIPWFD
jgi:hypothetical protein